MTCYATPIVPAYTTNHSASLPQIPFPEFDVSNPKPWKKKCETYFDIYNVLAVMWVNLATIYFTGPAVFGCSLIESPHPPPQGF